MTRSDFEERQARRKERLLERAKKAEQEAKAGYDAADRIAKAIPMGQPILVGHHSERGHRADLKRIDRGMRKAIEGSAEAKKLRERAAAVGKGGVSSDDPEAVSKLQEKLVELQAEQERRKKVNAAWRKCGSPAPNEPEIWKRVGEALAVDLEALAGLRMEMAKRWHFQPGAPFPTYALSNLSSEIRRVRARIEELETGAQAERVEVDHGICRLLENVEENRIQLFFSEKPDEASRGLLKRFGFRWSPKAGAWQRHLNNMARASALAVVGALQVKKEEPSGP